MKPLKLVCAMSLLIAVTACAALRDAGGVRSAATLVSSKVQPKEMLLNEGSKATGNGKKAVPFNHETHSLKNYSADGKSVIGCAECHHTDAPAGTLKGEFTTDDDRKITYKTSERTAVLTTKLLEDAAAAPVKGCNECHAREGEKPPAWPKMPEVPNPDGEPDPFPVTNEVAYHDNCNTCHKTVKKRNPATKAPTSCGECHSK